MHEHLKVDENAPYRKFLWQVALVDDGQGVLLLTGVPGQGLKGAQLGYWNLRTGTYEPDPRGYPKTHTCRCLSANGRYAIIGTRKNLHHIWDRTAGKVVARLDVPPEYGWLYLSDDAQTVALGGKPAAVWHASTGTTRPLRALKEGISLLSPSGKHLIGPPATSVYDAERGTKLFTFPGFGSFGTFSPDSRSFLHTYCHRAKLFDLETGEKRESLVAPFEVIGGAVSADHTRIAAGGTFQGVRVWEVPSEDILATWDVRDRFIRRLCFSADGSRLVSASDGGVLYLWDVVAGERACLVLLNNDAWVTLTPDGYFIGSDNLAGEAQWQIDGKAVAFDRYAREYHRPTYVTKALRSGR
jgi:WD40 repeat protein